MIICPGGSLREACDLLRIGQVNPRTLARAFSRNEGDGRDGAFSCWDNISYFSSNVKKKAVIGRKFFHVFTQTQDVGGKGPDKPIMCRTQKKLDKNTDRNYNKYRTNYSSFNSTLTNYQGANYTNCRTGQVMELLDLPLV